MSDSVIEDMLESALIKRADSRNIDSLLDTNGLVVLFFSGAKSHSRESHDVAVALRELLKDYGDYRDQLCAAVVAEADEASLQARFRVQVMPSIVFVADGEALEVLPGVKDWAIYSSAFQRYMGAPQTIKSLLESSS